MSLLPFGFQAHFTVSVSFSVVFLALTVFFCWLLSLILLFVFLFCFLLSPFTLHSLKCLRRVNLRKSHPSTVSVYVCESLYESKVFLHVAPPTQHKPLPHGDPTHWLLKRKKQRQSALSLISNTH